ncbi:hypothetical protein DFJ74DRAFT_200952 [Hyaloraphidium curvatum]|nr:hypothetical protein DFJ74DRAFT_200952 [Hyaloraphidium curvatum]
MGKGTKEVLGTSNDLNGSANPRAPLATAARIKTGRVPALQARRVIFEEAPARTTPKSRTCWCSPSCAGCFRRIGGSEPVGLRRTSSLNGKVADDLACSAVSALTAEADVSVGRNGFASAAAAGASTSRAPGRSKSRPDGVDGSARSPVCRSASTTGLGADAGAPWSSHIFLALIPRPLLVTATPTTSSTTILPRHRMWNVCWYRPTKVGRNVSRSEASRPRTTPRSSAKRNTSSPAAIAPSSGGISGTRARALPQRTRSHGADVVAGLTRVQRSRAGTPGVVAGGLMLTIATGAGDERPGAASWVAGRMMTGLPREAAESGEVMVPRAVAESSIDECSRCGGSDIGSSGGICGPSHRSICSGVASLGKESRPVTDGIGSFRRSGVGDRLRWYGRIVSRGVLSGHSASRGGVRRGAALPGETLVAVSGPKCLAGSAISVSGT